MLRESLEPDARNVFIHISGENGSVLQARQTTGGKTTNDAGSDPTLPIGGWVRLTRSGTIVLGEISVDGNSWHELGRYDVALGPEALIGLAVTAHASGQVATATFSNLKFRRGPIPVNPSEPVTTWPQTAATVTLAEPPVLL